MSVAASASTRLTRAAKRGVGRMEWYRRQIMMLGMLGFIRATWDDQWTQTVDPDASAVVRAAQGTDVVGTVLTIVVTAVVGYIGLTVMSNTEDSTDFSAGSEFENASGALTAGVAGAYDLMEPLFLVLILGIIIAVLVGLRG